MVTLDFDDAEALWAAFAVPGPEDILAREAFERELRFAAGLEDVGLYSGRVDGRSTCPPRRHAWQSQPRCSRPVSDCRT
jgi:hypothetical protein